MPHADVEPAASLLRVFAAGAVKSVIEDLLAAGGVSGAEAELTFDTAGALRDAVLAGARPDILILSASALEAVVTSARLGPLRERDLGRTGVGLAGPRDREPVAIDTPERLRDVLVSAPSIGYADPARGATAGAHFVATLDRLGLRERLQPRLRAFPFGVDAVSAVGRGEVAIAVSQATEILPRRDVSFLGLLPAPFQTWTSYRAVALSDHPGAHDVMDALTSPSGAAALRRAGFL